MNLSLINQEDWAEFENRYPEAVAFLLRSSLLNERKYLEGRMSLSVWESSRLAELQGLFGEGRENGRR